jgi:5-(carboxyamino)imidazole ribonucleotide mutase
MEIMRMPALVAVVMGSNSDWETMRHAAGMLDKLGVPCDVRVLSAHRTPDELFAWIKEAEAKGVEVFVAAAGGSAHLAGVVAAKTLLPVLGVPMETNLQGLDSLLSMVQMPAGIPVGTLGVGKAGAVNAALLATAILANKHGQYRAALKQYRDEQAKAVLAVGDPRGSKAP